MKEFIKRKQTTPLSITAMCNKCGLLDKYYDDNRGVINKQMSVIANTDGITKHNNYKQFKRRVFTLYHNAPYPVRYMTACMPYRSYTKIISYPQGSIDYRLSLRARKNSKRGLSEVAER